MKAETAYNVLQALEPHEVERFYRMLGVVKAEPKTPKIIGGITDTELTERTIKTLKLKK
tara:strand:+ start:9705 stop:9881 length:177 start_codon:yes stop_codon:yes gene_type:complete